MSMSGQADTGMQGLGVSLAGLRFAVFSTRNMVFLLAVLAMNYTLSRPSPVDMLYISAFLLTLFHLTLFPKFEVTRRALMLALLLGSWAVFFFVPSVAHLGEEFVAFELLAKTFAIAIGVIGAFVSMSWNRRHFETFMRFYVVSCVVASILGTIGFLLQTDLLTWDGRAKGLIDDPNMYGSFLIPALIFCAYLLARPRSRKLVLLGAMAIILLGILLSFSRIAVVASAMCLFGFFFFQNRRHPRRLVMIIGGTVAIGVVLFALASLTSAEFTAKLLDRLTFAKSYDLGEEGRYARYLLVLPMIMNNPIGVGVLQLEKIFPEPIHNIWLSSFVNYGWGGGITWITLVISSVVVSIRNYRRTRDDIVVAIMISMIAIVMCTSLHEGEHWRHLWLMFGMVWGVNVYNLGAVPKGKPGNRPAPPSARTSAGVPLPNAFPQTGPLIAAPVRRSAQAGAQGQIGPRR